MRFFEGESSSSQAPQENEWCHSVPSSSIGKRPASPSAPVAESSGAHLRALSAIRAAAHTFRHSFDCVIAQFQEGNVARALNGSYGSKPPPEPLS